MKKWEKILKAKLGNRVHTDRTPKVFGYNPNCEHCEITMPFVELFVAGVIH